MTVILLHQCRNSVVELRNYVTPCVGLVFELSDLTSHRGLWCEAHPLYGAFKLKTQKQVLSSTENIFSVFEAAWTR